MTTPLVAAIRTQLRDAERPLTPVERVQLLATLAKPTEGPRDTLDELRDAIAYARTTFSGRLGGSDAIALRALLRAAAAVLDNDTAPTTGSTAAVAAGHRGLAAAAAAAPHWTEREALTSSR